MEQRHWWKEDRYWHRGEACRNESDSPLFLEMIAEATRQGIQQGKREAWEEAKEIVANFTPTHITRDYRDTDAMRDNIVHVFNVELSALDNSSKE